MSLREFFDDNGGVVGTAVLASYYGVKPGMVSAWAEANEVSIIGNGYAFCFEKAAEFALESLGIDEDEEDEEDNDEDDAESEEDGDESGDW